MTREDYHEQQIKYFVWSWTIPGLLQILLKLCSKVFRKSRTLDMASNRELTISIRITTTIGFWDGGNCFYSCTGSMPCALGEKCNHWKWCLRIHTLRECITVHLEWSLLCSSVALKESPTSRLQWRYLQYSIKGNHWSTSAMETRMWRGCLLSLSTKSSQQSGIFYD